MLTHISNLPASMVLQDSLQSRYLVPIKTSQRIIKVCYYYDVSRTVLSFVHSVQEQDQLMRLSVQHLIQLMLWLNHDCLEEVGVALAAVEVVAKNRFVE